jgi:hypothetical protein
VADARAAIDEIKIRARDECIAVTKGKKCECTLIVVKSEQTKVAEAERTSEAPSGGAHEPDSRALEAKIERLRKVAYDSIMAQIAARTLTREGECHRGYLGQRDVYRKR